MKGKKLSASPAAADVLVPGWSSSSSSVATPSTPPSKISVNFSLSLSLVFNCIFLSLISEFWIYFTISEHEEDEKETKHLEAMEGAESRLRLFQIDLLDYNSILAAITGATGVFHLASPCIVDDVRDPEVDSAFLFLNGDY